MLLNGKEFVVRLKDREYHCAMDITMNFIGGKWKTVVLWYLRDEKRRFNELKRLIPGITEKMLSLQLKRLEQDGLVLRSVHAASPPKVDYGLTKFGKSLRPVLDEVARWGRRLGEKEGTLVEKLSPKHPRPI